jgi:hydroxymethylbilane synthase
MNTLIKMGTRPSRLALKQVQEIKKLTNGISYEIVPIETSGDKDKKTPLTLREGSNFFTYEIEQALLSGCIDMAVHSAKDLETAMPKGLRLIGLTDSISPYDCLVSRPHGMLNTLKTGAIIGTSSKNRMDAIKKYRSDLVVKSIRGNVDERLNQLDIGEYDAIIVAHAALIRLGLINRISQIIPLDIIDAHPLQGRLAIQIREDRKDLLRIFKRSSFEAKPS